MKNNFFRIAVALSIVMLLTISVYLYLRQPKIAYVRSQDLIDKYQGTLEARKEFEKKKHSLVANLDSLKLDFERAKNQYIASMNSMKVEQRIEQEKILTQQQNQLIQYNDAISLKVQEEDSKMMQEVLNQVNSFIEEFAIRENYAIILGTTSSGSLLYGENSFDITEVVVAELNQHYKGQ